MTRMIDADALNKKLCETTIFIEDGEVFQRMINDAPTIEPDADTIETLSAKLARHNFGYGAWIPVGDKLPEIGKRVLVYVMGDKALLCFHEVRDSYIGIYMGDGRWGVWIYDGMRLLNNEDVLAWTPLPKPYKKSMIQLLYEQDKR